MSTTLVSGAAICRPVPDVHNPGLADRLRYRLDHLTKPLGALGRLEALALQVGLILGSDRPQLRDPQMVVWAGDHGLAVRGVSAYPQAVTAQMVQNFLAGGAAINVLARQHGLALTVVDAGVAADLLPHPLLRQRKVAHGTADASEMPAMTPAQCEQALQQGAALVHELPGNVLLLGEMGIGNTSSAALIMARLTGVPLVDCVGRGTGLDEAGLKHKLSVLQATLTKHDEAVDPLHVLQTFGGFEIAMMCGAVLAAAADNRVIMVDGFIASCAVLVAQAIEPHVLQRCVFAHQSDELGHARLLSQWGVSPLLCLGLRLGEGSGAALAWPLLVSACTLFNEMASFESAGVSLAQAHR